MERKLLTKRGRALYKKRGVLVEPVFGQMKEGQEFRRFKRRGLDALNWNQLRDRHTIFGYQHRLARSRHLIHYL